MKFAAGFIASFVIAVFPVCEAFSQVIISGNLRGVLPDTTYIVAGPIQVSAGDSLWIEPGAVFLFDGSYDFDIYGYLSAVGTENDSIVFRPNDGVESFGSIIFRQGSSDDSELSYALITGANSSAINAYYVAVTISHCSVVNNHANWGGGIYFSHADGLISDCVITDNECVNNGGGIYCTGASPIIQNCIILRNRSNIGGSGSGRGGGGVCANHSSSPIILDSIIEDNYSAENGGGISINDNSHVTVFDTQINDNAADSSGGGIFISSNCNPILLNSEVRDNTAINGGGIYLEFNADLDVDSTSITGNTAQDEGGGIACRQSTPTFNRCEIASNSAVDGGGIHFSDSDSLEIMQSTLSENISSGQGGGIYLESSTLFMLNSIVAGSVGGGGIYFITSDSTTIAYSDFFGNGAGDFTGAPPPDLGVISGTNANGDPCDRFFNIFLDPSFVDPANLDFHLQEGSPCIDAGDPLSPLDPDDTVADIGVHYFEQLSVNEQPDVARDFQICASVYPNPFNPTTVIRFDLPHAAKVKLDVFDVGGRRVGVDLASTRVYSPGAHEITFDGSGLPSGVYIYRLTAGEYTASGKMVLMK